MEKRMTRMKRIKRTKRMKRKRSKTMMIVVRVRKPCKPMPKVKLFILNKRAPAYYMHSYHRPRKEASKHVLSNRRKTRSEYIQNSFHLSAPTHICKRCSHQSSKQSQSQVSKRLWTKSASRSQRPPWAMHSWML
jgi:hypothetical protein